VPVLLDTYDAALREALPAGADWIKLNRHEWDGLTPAEREPLLETAFRTGTRALVLTNGAAPVDVVTRAETVRAHPPQLGERCALGSGDCMAGAMALALDEGWDLLPAVRFGMAAGAANATRLHFGGFSRDQVEAFLPQIAFEPPSAG
jgi:fructose-1-phosphate kinase PfkB-like protein